MVRKALSASEIFRRRFKGSKNFMTPQIENRGKINRNVAFEVSSGRRIIGKGRMFGVTVVSVAKSGKTRSLHDKSSAFETRGAATSYINKLKRKFK